MAHEVCYLLLNEINFHKLNCHEQRSQVNVFQIKSCKVPSNLFMLEIMEEMFDDTLWIKYLPSSGIPFSFKFLFFWHSWNALII